MKLSLDAKNDQASIKITGPDGKWFAVGLGAKTFTMVGFFYETAFYESKNILDPSLALSKIVDDFFFNVQFSLWIILSQKT